jgi:hypothetical protein
MFSAITFIRPDCALSPEAAIASVFMKSMSRALAYFFPSAVFKSPSPRE